MEDKIFRALKKELPQVQENILLKNHTTFAIGGPAKYFLEVTGQEEFIIALKVAKKLSIPFFILGGGSNLLVSDKGFLGLVIKVENKKITAISDTIIQAEAGAGLGDVVDVSIEHSLEGLEWAGGLPGTFGGAIRGNAGAFGGEIKDAILNVAALDNNLELKNLSNAECGFSYRSSIFKRENWIVLSASVQFKKQDKEKLKEIANSRRSYRKEKHPLEYPNAGSVFKNVDVKDIPEKFQALFADKIKKDPFPIVPSAWFIIGAELTGKKIGQAQISEKHSNYIVNTGGAKAQDVLELIKVVKVAVKQKYGIELEQEIQYLE